MMNMDVRISSWGQELTIPLQSCSGTKERKGGSIIVWKCANVRLAGCCNRLCVCIVWVNVSNEVVSTENSLFFVLSVSFIDNQEERVTFVRRIIHVLVSRKWRKNNGNPLQPLPGVACLRGKKFDKHKMLSHMRIFHRSINCLQDFCQVPLSIFINSNHGTW